MSIRDLRVSTVIGVYDWEREIEQALTFSVDMAADVAKAARNDDIRDALDYSAVAQTVKSVVIEGKFQLIETAAEAVAQRLVADYGLAWVRVEVVKPIPSEGYTAAITIERGPTPRAAGVTERCGTGDRHPFGMAIKAAKPDRCGRTAAGEQLRGSSFLSVVDSTFRRGLMSETLTLPVLPLDDDVVLPGMVVPIELTDNEVRGAIDAARNSKGLGRGPGIRSEEKAQVLIVPRIGDRGLAGTGTLAVIEQVGRLPGGEPGAVLRGVSPGEDRPRDHRDRARRCGSRARSSRRPAGGPKATELAKEYKSLVIAMLQKRGAWQVVDMVQQIDDPSAIADRAGYASYLTAEQKLQLLETADVTERLEQAIRWIKDHLAELDVAETIRKDVTEGMEKQQKEFLLRQQLAAVRKELDELTGGGKGTEEDDYRARVEAADLPEKVREAALREVDKLERTSDAVARGRLDPHLARHRSSTSRGTSGPRTPTTSPARGAILDEDHAGLDDVKDRIIEYLAVRKRRSDRGLGVVGGRRSGAVLALVGPPGVGKTSLGESVARAMDRKFVRVALGGVRDEAEIRGHRRTYVGALPGRIVRAIREAGTMNPVVLLDEVDKIGADYRGDPAAALLEVLDPAQNHTFRDHYLEVDLDLSDVVFLATANVLDSIPGPLLDRMELVHARRLHRGREGRHRPGPPAAPAAGARPA